MKLSDSIDYLRKDAPETNQLVIDMHEHVQVVICSIQKVHRQDLVKMFIGILCKFCVPGALRDSLWIFGNPSQKGISGTSQPKGWISPEYMVEVFKVEMPTTKLYQESDGKLPSEVGKAKVRPAIFTDDILFCINN